MKSILQNVDTGEIIIGDIPAPVLKPGNVLVENYSSLVSVGTEKAVLEFSKSSNIKKAFLRPDLFTKILNRAKNEGLWQTYKIVNELMAQEIQLGYSCSGKVIDVGEEVVGYKVGDRVACSGLFAATHSEVVSVPTNLVTLIDENVSYEEASFVTIIAIALQAIRLSKLQLSENVVIYGLGLVGMICAQLANAAGCRVIGVDIDPRKVDLVESFGCIGIIGDEHHVENILQNTKYFGADKVLLCAATKSNKPIELVPEFTRQAGLLVVVGDVPMNIPRRSYYDKEIDIKVSRSYGPGRYDLAYEEGGIDYPYAYVRWTENRNMASGIDLLSRNKIDVSKLISHRFKINQGLDAYKLLESPDDRLVLGLTIDYQDRKQIDDKKKHIRVNNKEVIMDNFDFINLGVLGAGNFGKAFLLPAFKKVSKLNFVGVCTASGVSSANVAKKYKMQFATNEPSEIIKNKNINAVMIATRHDSHAKYVLDSLKNDKAVYVEKPLCLTMNELALIEQEYNSKKSEGKNPYLMVGYNRRFSPLSMKLKKLFLELNRLFLLYIA